MRQKEESRDGEKAARSSEMRRGERGQEEKRIHIMFLPCPKSLDLHPIYRLHSGHKDMQSQLTPNKGHNQLNPTFTA